MDVCNICGDGISDDAVAKLAEIDKRISELEALRARTCNCLTCRVTAEDYPEEIAAGACRRCGGSNDTDYKCDNGHIERIDCHACDGTGFAQEDE